MKVTAIKANNETVRTKAQDGSAIVIALLILLLLMAFAALAISRTSTEITITGNDISEARAFAASEASLENMTRDFVDIFEQKIIPSSTDIETIKNRPVPGFSNFTFTTNISKTSENTPTVLTGGSYSGLYSLRDSWVVESYAAESVTDVKVQLKRRFYSDRIPIFQFGIFSQDDLEINRPPFFTFGGRVHTNGNLFITAQPASWGDGIYFNSRVTAVGEVINDTWKPGVTGTNFTSGVDDQGNVFISDASGTPQQLLTGQGSVNCTSPSGTNVFADYPHLPNCSANPNWDSEKVKFQGNLENKVAKLILPLSKLDVDAIEIIKRGKNVGDVANLNGTVSAIADSTKDVSAVSKERFANKAGLRITLSDSQAKLPGCANVASGVACGVRLDAQLGSSSIGYQPLAMSDGYQATALNATRLAMSGREVWIKIELTNYDYTADSPVAVDVTQDILSLGVTEPAPIGANLQISGYTSSTDSRSIVKLQRFAMSGPSIPNAGTTTFTTNYTINGASQNLVVRYNNVTSNPSSGCSGCTAQNVFAYPVPEPSASSSMSQEDAAHLKWASINGSQTYAIVPFPIQMFDTREGLPNDDMNAAASYFGGEYLPSSGVMSLIDIDVANLRKFLNGDFNGLFPTSTPFAVAKARAMKSTDVPTSNGWVLYVSDRRGDYDFDGEYDMEDIFPDNTLQFNEDVNHNGVLNTDFGREAPSYSTSIARGQAAVADHLYYRRGVRLINGSTIPGIYDSATPTNTKGFTVSSENAVYVKGNYNATGVGLSGSTSVTPTENYSPQNTANHIPASVVADAVIILSNSWNDANSFANPFDRSKRVASDTIVRFAMLAGDPETGLSSYYQPSYFGQLNGGVHNFKRFLEDWNNKRLNYTGSLINLFNSRNNNGFLKCCNTVYRPPVRDWTFDSTFLNASRLPPGTPNIFSITFTGFERVN